MLSIVFPSMCISNMIVATFGLFFGGRRRLEQCVSSKMATHLPSLQSLVFFVFFSPFLFRYEERLEAILLLSGQKRASASVDAAARINHTLFFPPPPLSATSEPRFGSWKSIVHFILPWRRATGPGEKWIGRVSGPRMQVQARASSHPPFLSRPVAPLAFLRLGAERRSAQK